jgi:hypothetical protein
MEIDANKVLFDFLNLFLQAVLPVLAAALAGWLYSQARLAWQKFQNARPDVADSIQWAAEIAVRAAEQANLGGLIDDKKHYALQFAQRWLELKKIPIDLEALDGAIEAAVWSELNADQNKGAKLLRMPPQ